MFAQSQFTSTSKTLAALRKTVHTDTDLAGSDIADSFADTGSEDTAHSDTADHFAEEGSETGH